MQKNITRTWLTAIMEPDETRADALRWLNKQTGKHYSNSRLNEWLRGDREPVRSTRVVMMRDVFRYYSDVFRGLNADDWT